MCYRNCVNEDPMGECLGFDKNGPNMCDDVDLLDLQNENEIDLMSAFYPEV